MSYHTSHLAQDVGPDQAVSSAPCNLAVREETKLAEIHTHRSSKEQLERASRHSADVFLCDERDVMLAIEAMIHSGEGVCSWVSSITDLASSL